MIVAYLSLLGATLVWGVSFVIIQRTVAAYPTLSFLGLRFAAAALAVAPLMLTRASRPTRAAWRGGASMGACLALGYLGQTFGLRFTTVSNSGFLTGLYVVLTPLLAFIVLGRRPGGRVLLAVLAATAGLALLSGWPTASPRDARLGDWLTLGGALGFSVHFLVGERHAPRHPVATLNFVQFAVVAVACLAGGAALEGLPPPPPAVWGAIAFTSMACTVLGFAAQTYAQARLPATVVALVLSLEAPFAALFGYWLAGDRLGSTAWLGAALVLGASVVVATAPSVGQPLRAARLDPSP
ncbi:MAG: DMT family transporter [Myxococcota bacterium]